MMGYGRIYGGDASRLLKQYGAEAWGAIVENGRQMQRLAQIVCETLPMRKVTEPYLDLLELTVPEKAAFFGGRMIFEAEAQTFQVLRERLMQEECFRDGRYAVAFAADEPIAMQKLMQTPRTASKQMQSWKPMISVAPKQRETVLLSFPIRGRSATGNAMERRAFAREALSFGEIAYRLVQEVGGETACCGDGVLVFAVPAEKVSECTEKVAELCRKKLLPLCESQEKMPKIQRILR